MQKRSIHAWYIITWLAPWAAKMNRILRCDWLTERKRWRYLAHSGLPAVSRKKIVFFSACNKSFDGKDCSVKVAEYCTRFLVSTLSWFKNIQKRTCSICVLQPAFHRVETLFMQYKKKINLHNFICQIRLHNIFYFLLVISNIRDLI